MHSAPATTRFSLRQIAETCGVSVARAVAVLRSIEAADAFGEAASATNPDAVFRVFDANQVFELTAEDRAFHEAYPLTAQAAARQLNDALAADGLPRVKLAKIYSALTQFPDRRNNPAVGSNASAMRYPPSVVEWLREQLADQVPSASS